MRRKVPACLFILFIAGLVWAGEPWNTKPSKDWNEKEVNQILANSPWAKTITAPAYWLRTGHQGLEVGTKISIPPPRDAGRSQDADLKSPPDIHDKAYDQYARFPIRWESARTIRAATKRKSELQGNAAVGVPDKELAGPSSEFELVLLNDSLAPFPIADEMQLSANTYLLVVGTQRKVYAHRVRIRRRGDGQILEIRFFFPKTDSRSHSVFSGKETAIEFQCYVAGSLLRAKFEPGKMRDLQGSDL